MNERFSKIVDLYESDWEKLTPIIFKLTRLVDDVKTDDKKVEANEHSNQRIHHTSQLLRNQLSALTRTVNAIELKVCTFDEKLSAAINEYDVFVMGNFKVCTEAINKTLDDYDARLKKKLSQIEKDLTTKIEMQKLMSNKCVSCDRNTSSPTSIVEKPRSKSGSKKRKMLFSTQQ